MKGRGMKGRGKKAQGNGSEFLCPHSFVPASFGQGGELDKIDPLSLISEKTNLEEGTREWRTEEWF
jgi:hypothetical protein